MPSTDRSPRSILHGCWGFVCLFVFPSQTESGLCLTESPGDSSFPTSALLAAWLAIYSHPPATVLPAEVFSLSALSTGRLSTECSSQPASQAYHLPSFLTEESSLRLILLTGSSSLLLLLHLLERRDSLYLPPPQGSLLPGLRQC